MATSGIKQPQKPPTPTGEYQRKFFDIIAKRNQKGQNIHHELMDVLGVKRGAAYKRMNGETALSLEEVIKLADYFNVSLDAMFRSDKYISFFHPFVHKEKTTMDVFLNQFQKFMRPLRPGSQVGKIDLTYLANELPVFYYFGHKYIFNFLMSIWRHLHWDDHHLEITSNPDYEKRAHEFRDEILNNYYSHKVTEVWNSNMLNNLYQQVIFSVTIRAFREAKYIELLVNDIANLIQHLRRVSVDGVKYIKGEKIDGSELKIYLNDFGNYLNVVQYGSTAFKSTFIGYDYPQFIVSHNAKFFDFSSDWIQRIKKRSVLISSEGYQFRELFFMKMDNDFDYFKTRVEKLVDVYY
jgi:transcriptional regulator with XRE-family HTH domain